MTMAAACRAFALICLLLATAWTEDATSSDGTSAAIAALIAKGDQASLAEALKRIDSAHAQLGPEAIGDLLARCTIAAQDRLLDQTKADALVADALGLGQRLLELDAQWGLLRPTLANEALPSRSERPERDRVEADRRLGRSVAAFSRALFTTLDPKFDPDRLPALNVAPPAATGLPAGIAPSAIADPGLRAEYQRALDENAAYAARYRQQQTLRRLERDAGEHFAAWIALQPLPARPVIRQALSQGGVPEDFIKRLFPPEPKK
jgi:hypothetical protein